MTAENLAPLLLGALQGITEFLPISSSGHLVLLQQLLGMGIRESVLMDVVLHFGTLMAIITVFRRDLMDLVKGVLSRGRIVPCGDNQGDSGLVVGVMVGSIPPALMGVLLRPMVEGLFGSLFAVGIGWLITGTCLTATRISVRGEGKGSRIGMWHALIIGVAQGVALVPGISRSGMTIGVGLLLGLRRELAARFSFLLALPTIIGAMTLEVFRGFKGDVGLGGLLAGGLTAWLVGTTALIWLLRIILEGRFYRFSPYCLVMGVGTILWELA